MKTGAYQREDPQEFVKVTPDKKEHARTEIGRAAVPRFPAEEPKQLSAKAQNTELRFIFDISLVLYFKQPIKIKMCIKCAWSLGQY